MDFRRRLKDLFAGRAEESASGGPVRIGKYTVVEELGQGATSTVYRGRDEFAREDVAIKLVRPEVLHDPEQASRCYHLFATEAALVGRLSHPNIVAIRDAVQESKDLIYLVMEYVGGGTLREHCAPDRLLPVPRVLEVIFKCANALDYAARNGIIHRDVKPANILLTEEGNVRLSDFGAAIFQQFGEVRTQISGIGSPAYMSPEQIQGDDLDARTDIFALGVVFYQLLTGHLPFTGESDYALMFNIVNREPTPLHLHRRDVPDNLVAIVDRCLARPREKRYPNWEAFTRDLSGLGGVMDISGAELSDSEKFTTLKRLDFFRNFGDVELWEVVRLSQFVSFRAGETIIEETSMGREFYVLISGKVDVLRDSTRLSSLEAGACFGEMAYIRSHYPRRSASVVSASYAEAIRVDAEALQQAGSPCQLAFNRAFLQVLVDRLELANESLTMRLMP